MSAPAGLVIAGTHSGCGKTTLTLGIMAALRRRGILIHPFKCGPDFIDPTLHQLVSGQVSRNLDVRMCGPDYVRDCFCSRVAAGGLAIVEGVMGLFDGARGSAAHLARLLGLPVILVVDVRSAAESVAAVIRGFESVDPQVRVAGVILNRVGSQRHEALIRAAVRRWCTAEIIGAIPADARISLPARHLGLHMGSEVNLDIDHLAGIVTKHLDCARLERLGRQAQVCQWVPPAEDKTAASGQAVRLGVAWDEAFCFYYQDNLDMLAAAGAELCPFSPLHDRCLPRGLAGLYFGGGYPELHGAALAANREMRTSIRRFAGRGYPVYGECGGLMYLSQAIVDTSGTPHAMVGLFPAQVRMHRRLQSLGYRDVELTRPTLLGPRGQCCRGHEFHYSRMEPLPATVARAYRLGDGRREGYQVGNSLGSYVHLHWGGSPEVPGNMVAAMRRLQGGTEQ